MPEVVLTVIPGAVVGPADTVDSTVLNRLGNPVVSVPDGAGLGPAHMDMAALNEALAPALNPVNYLPSGALLPSLWRAPGGLTCVPGDFTENALDWRVSTMGVGLFYALGDGRPNSDTDWAARLTGASSMPEVQFYHQMPHSLSGQLLHADLVFSAWVYNGTGVSITPELWINGDAPPPAPESNSIPPAQWKRVWWRIHAPDFASFADSAGMQLGLSFPAGTLDATTKYVGISQLDLKAGTTLTAPLRAIPPQVFNSFFPGCMQAWPVFPPPNGWLECNGSFISKATYPDLHAVLGTTYGAVDADPDLFALPDLRGAVPMGRDDNTTLRVTIPLRAEVIGGSPRITLANPALRNRLGCGMKIYPHVTAFPAGATVVRFEGYADVIVSPAATSGGLATDLEFGWASGPIGTQVGGPLGPSPRQLRVESVLGGCSVVAGSPVLTLLAKDALDAGMVVTGQDIPEGTTIVGQITDKTWKMSANATATHLPAAPIVCRFRDPEDGLGQFFANAAADLRRKFVNVNISNSSAAISLPSSAGILPGMAVTGYVGILPGAVVATVLSATAITITPAPTATALLDWLEVSGSEIVDVEAPQPLPQALQMLWIIKT